MGMHRVYPFPWLFGNRDDRSLDDAWLPVQEMNCQLVGIFFHLVEVLQTQTVDPVLHRVCRQNLAVVCVAEYFFAEWVVDHHLHRELSNQLNFAFAVNLHDVAFASLTALVLLVLLSPFVGFGTGIPVHLSQIRTA